MDLWTVSHHLLQRLEGSSVREAINCSLAFPVFLQGASLLQAGILTTADVMGEKEDRES